MNYYAFNIGDYKAHTQHLTPMEDLVYRRMLDMYYLSESPLPDAQKIGRHICLRDHIEDIETILQEYFISTPEGFIHTRCEREIKAMNDKSGKAKASAQTRWQRGRNANALRTHCETDANASKNNANASDIDANAMRPQCEGNAPKTQDTRHKTQDTNIPPNPPEGGEDEGNPHLFTDSDTRLFFTMPLDWQPDPEELQQYVNGKAHDGKPLTLEVVTSFLSEYRESTHAKGESRTESQWCMYLVKWAQKCLLNPNPAGQQPQPVTEKKPDYWRPDPKRMMTPEELAIAIEAGKNLK